MNFKKINTEEELRERLFKEEWEIHLEKFVKELKRINVWDKLESFYIFADENLNNLNNLKNWNLKN